MASGQFLIRNRHQQVWYGRVVIPRHLRDHFNQRRELRTSLKTPDKQRALRLSRYFWLQCQQGFERLVHRPPKEAFGDTSDFLNWTQQQQKNRQTDMAYYIETFDVFGRKHIIDLDDPAKEQELAMALQANAVALLEAYKNQPDVLDRILQIGKPEFSAPANQPESPTTFQDAITLLIFRINPVSAQRHLSEPRQGACRAVRIPSREKPVDPGNRPDNAPDLDQSAFSKGHC
jgi:hypothetical protein